MRRAFQQVQGKPVSVGCVGPFSGAGTHKATNANRPSKHLSPASKPTKCGKQGATCLCQADLS